MFGRKKNKAQFNAMGDSRDTVYDFRRRIQSLFESYRCADYKVYSELTGENMKPRLDDHLEKLFDGEVDDGNGDMLDKLIFGAYRKAVSDLNMQRLDHKDMNRRLVARRKSDREDFSKLLEERRQALERVETEYESICGKIAEFKEKNNEKK